MAQQRLGQGRCRAQQRQRGLGPAGRGVKGQNRRAGPVFCRHGCRHGCKHGCRQAQHQHRHHLATLVQRQRPGRAQGQLTVLNRRASRQFGGRLQTAGTRLGPGGVGRYPPGGRALAHREQRQTQLGAGADSVNRPGPLGRHLGPRPGRHAVDPLLRRPPGLVLRADVAQQLQQLRGPGVPGQAGRRQARLQPAQRQQQQRNRPLRIRAAEPRAGHRDGGRRDTAGQQQRGGHQQVGTVSTVSAAQDIHRHRVIGAHLLAQPGPAFGQPGGALAERQAKARVVAVHGQVPAIDPGRGQPLAPGAYGADQFRGGPGRRGRRGDAGQGAGRRTRRGAGHHLGHGGAFRAGRGAAGSSSGSTASVTINASSACTSAPANCPLRALSLM